MIRIGQLGVGHNHGRAKIGAFARFPELFEIVGVAEPSEAWWQKRGHLYDWLPRMSEQELLTKVDAVVVETDVPDLVAAAHRCIKAGKHVHMDKPAGGNLEEYRSMLEEAQERGLVVQLGFMLRYNPGIARVVEAVRKGELGKIESVDAQMSTGHDGWYRRWLDGIAGDVRYIMGSNMVDLIVRMLGEPTAVHNFGRCTGRDGISYPDNNFTLLEYDDALVRLTVSSCEVNGHGQRRLVVSGDKAAYKIEPLESDQVVYYAEAGGDPYKNTAVPVAVPTLEDRYEEQAHDFHDYVVGLKENPYSYDYEYSVEKIIRKVAQI